MSGSHAGTVVVAMSGGVDSSVAAWLLKEQGYEVIGLYAECWDHSSEDPERPCTAGDDYQDVAYTAAVLDIPYFRVNLVDAYRRQVFAHLLAGYARGHAPNPDILCNRYIKFHDLYQHASGLDMTYFATGHYARNVDGQLYKGVDQNKDQSYFLYAVNPQVFAQVLFPLGEMSKTEVRSLARKVGLPAADKPDSMGICFVGQHKFAQFLSRYLPAKSGDFVDLSGHVVGQHQGAHLYTIGQRRGLGLGGPGERWYVVAKDMARNQVLVHRGAHPQMFTTTVQIHESRFMGWVPHSHATYQWCAKIRHGGGDQRCMVKNIRLVSPSTGAPQQSAEEGAYEAEVTFAQPQQALSVGQSVVFYEDQRCMGGGVIMALIA